MSFQQNLVNHAPKGTTQFLLGSNVVDVLTGLRAPKNEKTFVRALKTIFVGSEIHLGRDPGI